MKPFKTFAALILTFIALTSFAGAQTNIVRITGSTAFRGAVHTAISNLMPGATVGFAGTSLNGANQAVFTGNMTGVAGTTVVKTSWAGSVGGVQTLTQNLTIATWLQNGASGSGLTGPYDAPVTADVTMSDSFQGSTAFTTPGLTSKIVGVIVFEWVANNGSPTPIGTPGKPLATAAVATGDPANNYYPGLTNISLLQAKNLLAGGLPLSQFTGIGSESLGVYCVGRDEDSGTRLVAYAESKYGVFTSPTQYQPSINGTPGVGATVTALNPWPQATVLGTVYPVGHSGYNSGGSLADALATPGSSTATNGGWIVSYLGRNDATRACSGAGNTAHRLTYNGVADWTDGTSTIPGGAGVAADDASVIEGKYTFWSYEHLMYRSGFAGATVANLIADRIKNFDATVSGIKLSAMHVGRTVEGGEVTFGNPFP
ncbi:MAG: hypothetical protein QOE70_265 [Chthoniobacter sp.]|jgi:hypothetical protein|nr:hypothetical protein [Chthoniobacter sp.]